MTSMISRLIALVLGTLAVGGTARADFFVGNPSSSGAGADSWLFAKNSLSSADGRYIRGAGNFDFDMYRTQYSVASGDALTTMASAWTIGDVVLGMGGVMAVAANVNLTSSIRILSKFTSAALGLFTASSNPAPNGNGLGSFSAGHGGLGSVLLGNAPGAVTVADAGVLLVPTTAFQWNGTVGSNGLTLTPANNVARYVYTLDGNTTTSKLKSWQVLLNITKLTAMNTGFASPNIDGHWNQSLQRGFSTTLFTDAINQHMPVPPTMVAFAAGAAVLGFGRVLRRRAGA
jgi:hypothetical protein